MAARQRENLAASRHSRTGTVYSAYPPILWGREQTQAGTRPVPAPAHGGKVPPFLPHGGHHPMAGLCYSGCCNVVEGITQLTKGDNNLR